MLERILTDQSELLGTRESALRAIWHIDRKLGKEYERRYQGESKEFDHIIELLPTGR